MRQLAEQAFSRAAGAPLSSGNAIELLIDAQAHFDAWLAVIESARHYVLLDNYIVRDDDIGHAFLDALCRAARNGVTVCVIHDWLGCLGQSRRAFWNPLRAAGGEVRVFNPPRWDQPLGWISRDHRKMLCVDGRVGSLTGVCLSGNWLADPARGTPAWRDTGVMLRGPAVRDLENAFLDAWDDLGTTLQLPGTDADAATAGDVSLRIIATRPQTAGVYRLDQLIASMARETLWLTDAYFVGVSPYVQALAAAAHDGVDVRLLVPGSSDVPIVAAMSRNGYRPLLDAGVRVFEWQGSMLHAKTAVADGRWARVGSSNLNLASWIGNCEIDVAVENRDFARQMQQQYLSDLENATEVLLPRARRVAAARKAADTRRRRHYRGGSSSRAAASAIRLARNVGSVLTPSRTLGTDEYGMLLGAGGVIALTAVLAFLWPKLLAWPLALLLAWLGISLLWRGMRQRHRDDPSRDQAPPP